MNLQELNAFAIARKVDELNLISMEGGIYLLEARMHGAAYPLSDPKGQILLGNRKARQLFDNNLVGDDVLDQLARLGYPELSTEQRPPLSAMPLLEFRDYKERSLRLERAALLPVDGDTPIGWLLSLTDLSAERAAEEQRGVLLRFLSHDLRAPHSAILALLDVHRHQAGADSPLFEQIERQVRRALDLTDGFVLLARAESEAYQFQPSLFAMLVLDVLDQALPIAQQKRIELLHDMDEESQERLINADQGLLTRALFNLLENAIKYSPSGTTVRLRHSSAQGWLECRISDQGPGVEAAQLGHIFTPFYTSKAEGLGLGLSMSRSIIEGFGGALEARPGELGGLCLAQAGSHAGRLELFAGGDRQVKPDGWGGGHGRAAPGAGGRWRPLRRCGRGPTGVRPGRPPAPHAGAWGRRLRPGGRPCR